jgi:signal transduction histidine kinase
MESYVKKRGRLFYKVLVILLIVSLGPLIVAGYYIFGLSKDTLTGATLQNQQALAVGFSDTVYGYVISFKNVISDASKLEEFHSSDLSRQRETLSHLLQVHAAILEISYVDSQGNERIRMGRFLEREKLRDFSSDSAFRTARNRGVYIGNLERFLGSYPTITIAVGIFDKISGQNLGVIYSKISLNGLSSMLKTGFPESSNMTAAVIASDGFLIAHSDLNVIFSPNAAVPREVLDVLLSTPSKSGSGEILLSNGEVVFGTFAEVKALDWIVYIQMPSSAIKRASQLMFSKTIKALIVVTVLVLILGFVLSIFLIKPIELLREAAIRVGRGEFEDLPELSVPNDEIGELARAFTQMSTSLKLKTEEIVSAKEELEALNRSLESRVEARTRELRVALDELIKKERLATIGQMSSVVGHEIRNPLAIVNNSIYFIKTKLRNIGTSEPKIDKHISIIESEIKQANGIIDEILGFARTKEFVIESHDLNQYLQDILSSYPFASNIKIVREFSDVDIPVSIDADEMRQVIRNLIGNAVEVMEDGGTLSIGTSCDEEYAKIAISDTGPGMSKEMVDKIFTPFFTTKARGTGLGLAVVKKVIDKHKGKVNVKSKPGKGTTFEIYLSLNE